MTEEQLKKVVQDAVNAAFKDVGLHDAQARSDIAELRGFAAYWRDAKSTGARVIITAILMGVMALITLGSLSWFNKGN